MSIETLIEKLEQLTNESELKEYEWLTDANASMAERHKEMVGEIVDLADDFLITGSGRPHYEHIAVLKEKGFRVGPGETDSFGWLSGVIGTKKGKIVFG